MRILAVFFLLCWTSLSAQEQMWKADHDHTRIGFSAMFMGISKVEGFFRDYEMEIKASEEDFSDASAKVVIQAGSIETNNDKRDKDLNSESFLYVEKYPEIKFVSTSIDKQNDGSYKLTGDLTIRGITKSEAFNLEYNGRAESNGKVRAAFNLNGSINRFDYDVDWNESFIGGLVVSKEVKINCDVTLIKEGN